jgi:hypothetical protein
MALLVVQLTAALSLLPALFAPRPGWHTRHGRVHACPAWRRPLRPGRELGGDGALARVRGVPAASDDRHPSARRDHPAGDRRPRAPAGRAPGAVMAVDHPRGGRPLRILGRPEPLRRLPALRPVWPRRSVPLRRLRTGPPTPAQLASANAEPPDGQAPQVRSPEIVIEIRAEKSPCKRPAEITKVW